MRKNQPKKGFVLGAMLGSTLGALTAMVFTKKGRKIRENLMHQCHELGNKVKRTASKNKRKAKQAMSRIAKKIEKKIKH